MAGRIPENILRLHAGEESLRAKALALIEADARLALHLDITVHVMDLFDILRQFPTEDEDLKVIQVLGIRTFNAFASAIKLMLSGYSQKSALILRLTGMDPDRLAEDPSAPHMALSEYDVVIAIDPDWRELDENQVKLLKDWVANQAGGIVFVAGPVHTFHVARPAGIAGTPGTSTGTWTSSRRIPTGRN